MEQQSASPSRTSVSGASSPAIANLGLSGHRQRSRVCDNCIRQKVRCDLGQPICSRCFERGKTCTYSTVRRRPGPAPGSGRGPRASRGQQNRARTSLDQQVGFLNVSNFESTAALSPVSSGVANPVLSPESFGSTIVAHASTEADTQTSDVVDILPEEEKYLLDEYFKTVNQAIPLFSGTTPLDSSSIMTCSRDLVEAMLLVTAKLLGFKFASGRVDLEARIDQILNITSLQEDTAGDFPLLDQFRKSCLLAFYEFHQFPGHQVWMRVGKLVRIALWMGLDRLDVMKSISPEWNSVSDDDLKDWKLVWWFVYRLDSYVNLSSGTPYQIDERLVNTSLMDAYRTDHPSGGCPEPYKLPFHPGGLPDLLMSVKTSSENTLLFNIHIITATALRQLGRALSMRFLVPPEEVTAAFFNAERNLSVLRLALPRNFLNPGRNAFSNETSNDHHARLVAVLHLLMAQLLAALAHCQCLPEGDEWALSWQCVLEVCQNIAGITEKWDSNFIICLDPAVSLIIFTALVFLDIHKKFAPATSTYLLSEIGNCELLLLLQLEQFAAYWTLPGLLILSFKSFRESVAAPLSYRHIRLILSRFESPLHPRWLQFLSSAQIQLEQHI